MSLLFQRNDLKFASRRNLLSKDSLIKSLIKMPLHTKLSFCIRYFWRMKRKLTETITERCFSCQNKSVCQKLARSCKKMKISQKCDIRPFCTKPFNCNSTLLSLHPLNPPPPPPRSGSVTVYNGHRCKKGGGNYALNKHSIAGKKKYSLVTQNPDLSTTTVGLIAPHKILSNWDWNALFPS